MEGRGIPRPSPPNTSYSLLGVGRLQWRAGDDSMAVTIHHPPSMEGRGIPRPNADACALIRGAVADLQWRAGEFPGQTRQVVAA